MNWSNLAEYQCLSCGKWFNRFENSTCPNCGSPIRYEVPPIQNLELPSYQYTPLDIESVKIDNSYLNTEEAIELIDTTRNSLLRIGPNFPEEVDLKPMEQKLSSLEKEIKDVRKAQDEVKEWKQSYGEFKKEWILVKERLQEADLITTTEARELLDNFEKMDSLLNTDISHVPTSLFYTRLTEQMKLLEERLTLKVDANTEIREAYQDVLAQQKELYNWFKRAAFFTPIALAVAPSIEIFVKWLLGIS